MEVKNDIFTQEETHLDITVENLRNQITALKKRLHGVGLYETASDYDERVNLQVKKSQDQRTQKAIKDMASRKKPYLFKVQIEKNGQIEDIYFGKTENTQANIANWRAKAAKYYYSSP